MVTLVAAASVRVPMTGLRFAPATVLIASML